MSPPITVRLMTDADVDLGMRLKRLAGWGQSEADWRRFLTLSPEGCFVGMADGQPVGTVTTVVFGGVVGWIGMLLVDPSNRRRGYGRTLFTHAVAYLDTCGVTTIKLDATEAGRPLYRRLGFSDEYELTRWQGTARTFRGLACEPLHQDDIRDVVALDTPIYGVDRSSLLALLVSEFPDAGAIVRGADGRLRGYVLCQRGESTWTIGPLVALDEKAGTALACWAMRRLAGQPVFLDVPHGNRPAVSTVESCGFTCQRGFTRMYRGDDPRGGRPRLVWCSSGPSKG